jgi:hypothetical protein
VNTHIRKGERKPHILWACFNCLIDHTSGASLSVREALSQLSHFGYKVTILGATIFDSVSGSNRINSIREEIGISNGSFITINDYPLKHKLLCTNSSNKLKLSVIEQDIWFNEYLRLLDSTKPDVVFFYGGNNIDSMISYESKLRNIPVAFYLANNNYYGHRWHRDIDLILCDTESSAKMHKNVNGYNAKPIGKFIPPELVVAENHIRERILFI